VPRVPPPPPPPPPPHTHQVAPLSEILLGARGRYHSLLAGTLGEAVTATVEGDVLGELLVRTPQQAAAYAGLGLPWALDPPPGEGAGCCCADVSGGSLRGEQRASI
jgi:hypothetical protein